VTLIVALACKDGVVIASDSASTDPESGTKQLHDKIKRIGQEPILYGGSGDVGLVQKIDESLNAYMRKTSFKAIRQEIRKLILPELREASQFHAPYPQAPFHKPPEAVLLFAGVHDRKPWIIEIERDCRDTMYGEAFGNFAAIGSGKPLAQAIFYPHFKTSRDLKLGKIFAYRIIDDSINLAAAYLSAPVCMYTISIDGTVRMIDPIEREDIAKTCELWRTLERESVGKILAPPQGEVELPEIPKPE
jgi:20S proteasome alpha/beta subunit